MAFYFQEAYSPEIEQLLRHYYQSLSEKNRRCFAAIEAITLGHGGGFCPSPQKGTFQQYAPIMTSSPSS